LRATRQREEECHAIEEIVKKVADADPASAAPTVQPGSLDRDIRIRVRAKTLERQKKHAEVWSEVGDRPAWNRWAMQCDEGDANRW